MTRVDAPTFANYESTRTMNDERFVVHDQVGNGSHRVIDPHEMKEIKLQYVRMLEQGK